MRSSHAINLDLNSPESRRISRCVLNTARIRCPGIRREKQLLQLAPGVEPKDRRHIYKITARSYMYLEKYTKILIYHFNFKFEFALSSFLRLSSISKMKEMEKDVSPNYVFCLRRDAQKVWGTVISHGLKFSQKRSL